MRKYRNWLMGFGIGIILGASMLQLILFAKNPVMVAKEPITREQMDEEAKKAGLVILTEEQLTAKVEEAVAASLEQSNNVDSEDQEGINDSEAALKPPTASVTPEPEASKPATPDDSATDELEPVTLRVDYGMSLTEVANELKRLGLIDDTKDFINEARPISKRMKVGKSVFTAKPTYQEIIDELIRKK